MNLNLSCRFVGHQDNPVNWICINEDCKIRPACISCVTQNHNQHSHDVLDLSKFVEWQKQETNKVKYLTSQLLITIKQIISLSKPLKSFMQKLMTFQKFELNDQTIEQITNQVNRLLGFQKDQQAFQDQFSEINKYLQLAKGACENLNSPTLSGVVQPKIQNLIEYHFSEQEKHNQLEVKGDEISRKLFSGTQIYFCLCTPAIQDYSKLKIEVIEIRNQILLGICSRIKMRKNKFGEQISKLESLGHGCYLINSEGFCFSHHTKKINNEARAFTFSVGDSIQIEIKGNIIQWTKNKDQKTEESFQMEFENINDMFPVVGISPDCKIVLRK